MQCPSCQSENADAAEVCFHCRAVLSAVTRGSLVGARYRVIAPLGRGGMGAVYHAHDEVLDEDVALKILRPEVAGTPAMAARFRSEIKLARKVSHWNVCRIHEYGEDGGLQYISMELITGATLKDRLRSGPLPPADAFHVAVQIADGLAAIHKVGIVHRDLKSANVMVDGAGTAKVMDFGIAKAATGADGGSATGYVLGSPEYMSPEQARGRRADFRSDLYSLGIVVFEAFTGRVPFRGPTPVATLLMHVEAPPPVDDPSLALPPALLPVLRSALAKDPADRFPDAAAMTSALRAAAVASGQPLGTEEPAAPPALVEASRTEVVHTRPLAVRRPRTMVAAGAVMALIAAAAILLARRPAERPAGSAPPDTSASAIGSVAPSAPPTAAPGDQPPAATPPPPSATLAPRVERAPPSPRLAAAPPSPASESEARPNPSAAPSFAPPSPPSAIASNAAPFSAIASAVPSPAAPAAPTPAAPPAASASATGTAAMPVPIRDGRLRILVTPWADVSVDGRPVGMTPLAQLTLPAGSYALMLTHPQYKPYTRRVTIHPGETVTVRFDFATDGVRR
jgi:eukaryotic-like serine/threonine-protein kinase